MFGLQAIYMDAKVIHSSFAQTNLCVHFTGTGLLNQQWETYTNGNWDLHSAHSHSAGCLSVGVRECMRVAAIHTYR